MPRRGKSSWLFFNLIAQLLKTLTPPMLLFAACYLSVAAGVQLIKHPHHLIAHLTPQTPLLPEQTWQRYKALLQRYQTQHLTPEFLGAMIQAISAGQSWSVSSWTMDFSRKPWEIFQPESSEFGLMAWSSKGFDDAKNYCILQHQPASHKPWFKLGGCWGSFFRSRASAADSIELAAALMQHIINSEIVEKKISATTEQIHKFAAISHLCGKKSALHFMKHKFKLHDLHSCRGRALSPFFSTLIRHRNSYRKILKAEIAQFEATQAQKIAVRSSML